MNKESLFFRSPLHDFYPVQRELNRLIKMAEEHRMFIVTPRNWGKKYVQEISEILHWIMKGHLELLLAKMIADEYQGKWLNTTSITELFLMR